MIPQMAFSQAAEKVKEYLEDYSYKYGFERLASIASITALGGVVATILALESAEPRAAPVLTPSRQFWAYDINGNVIRDLDGDGDADLIHYRGGVRSSCAYWVAPDMVEIVDKGGDYSVCRSTGRMTPEIQKSATDVLNSQRQLEFEQDREKYRLHHEGGRR